MIQALQIESLLTFLKDCLRSDSTLVSALEAPTPDLVCASALEMEPVGFDGESLAIYVTEFPFLCAREASAKTIYAGPAHGQEAECKLWYGIKTPMGDVSGDTSVPSRAFADRWLRMVYWRLLFWFRTHKLGTRDVMTDGQIHRLGMPSLVRYRHVADVSLFEADFTLQYFLPPYLMTAPAELLGVDYTLGDTATPHAGTYVESEVDSTWP